MSRCNKIIEANLSRMNSIRSFANRPRLDKQEKPKRASEKKKMPIPTKIRQIPNQGSESWHT